MMHAVPERLNPFTLPLFGERLIEASAGTGKTFTIGVLYLRLLLGLGQSAAFSRPLTVEEILVVTFTEAATEELRGRIRSNIHTLRIACIRGESTDPVMAELMAEIDDRPYAIAQLLAAERQMDEAAIYTIHGFCQRMLTHHAFESGMLFEQTLVQDELPLYRQASADFWRRHCYQLPLAVARAVSQEWSGPHALLKDLSAYLQGETPNLLHPPAGEETVLIRHTQNIARIDSIKTQWQAAASELAELINQSGVDKRSYSSKHLPNWLNKVGKWAEQPTTDYQLPNELEKFRQSVLLAKTNKGEAPHHHLFVAIDALFSEPLTLRDLIMAQALGEIRASIEQEKRQRAELGFDDLLSKLDNALQGVEGEALALSIRQRYPVAMIDEFQDTDPQQYRIFQKIYRGQTGCGLLLIGDPKQAIYAFRGADIFTYMQARSEVSAHYTLETNWRSSPAMVNSVNRLFRQVKQPFLFEQIPFLAVSSAQKNQTLAFQLQGTVQPAMQFWLQPGDDTGVADYQQHMANQCAAQIRDWLIAGEASEAWLVNGEQQHRVEASHIAVLVRSRTEAALVRNALSALDIPSVYLSNRDSVFDTPEAKDLLWLLQAVLTPEQERTLRTALATRLLGLDASTLDALNHNEQAWDPLVNEFDEYRTHWSQYGVLPMLREIMTKRHLAEDLLASPEGERRLTDIMHLGELLQETSAQLEGEHALVRWLAQQIAAPNRQSSTQQLRLESDRHLVKVLTIHKSKGLEFELVWLPFAASYRQKKNPKHVLYHDRQTFNALLDLHANPESIDWAQEERLAEDLRLLYVAVTRSIYHCSIGIAPLFVGGRKKQGNTDLHQGALGYLVQAGLAGDARHLQTCLQQLITQGMALSLATMPEQRIWQPKTTLTNSLAARKFSRRVYDFWRVTSYSGLHHHRASKFEGLLPHLDIDAAGEFAPDNPPVLTPHTFPRGVSAGTFLHGLFETLDFTQPLEKARLLEQLQQHGVETLWLDVLFDWMQTLLNTPLNASGLKLSALSAQTRQAELGFYLPIQQPLQAGELDALAKRYDPLSARCPALDFQQVQGMLKGFIDLVFCWQGKYYLLDYKSNWLGESSSAYTQPAMEQAMVEHRYDLQYQLYTLALHRYLRHRLANYDYEQHFGGVIYLFLRGMDAEQAGTGVFICRPELALVNGMDQLFSGEKHGLGGNND